MPGDFSQGGIRIFFFSFIIDIGDVFEKQDTRDWKDEEKVEHRGDEIYSQSVIMRNNAVF